MFICTLFVFTGSPSGYTMDMKFITETAWCDMVVYVVFLQRLSCNPVIQRGKGKKIVYVFCLEPF